MLDCFRKNHSLSDAMMLNGELTEMKRREDERKEALRKMEEEAEKKRMEARAAAEAQKPKEPEPPCQDMPAPPPAPAKEETVYDITFRAIATRQQLVELKTACDRIGVKIMRV